jgi:hypothetical protein
VHSLTKVSAQNANRGEAVLVASNGCAFLDGFLSCEMEEMVVD